MKLFVWLRRLSGSGNFSPLVPVGTNGAVFTGDCEGSGSQCDCVCTQCDCVCGQCDCAGRDC